MANVHDMTVDQLWPKRYLTAGDIVDPMRVTIENITIEKLWDSRKREYKQEGVVWFKEFPGKFFCVNRTNRDALIRIIGSRKVGDWIGKKVELYQDTFVRGSKTYMVIRVRAGGK